MAKGLRRLAAKVAEREADVNQTDELPLANGLQEQADRRDNQIAFWILVRHAAFATGVALVSYNMMHCLLVINGHGGWDDATMGTAVGAGLIAIVMPLPRRWF